MIKTVLILLLGAALAGAAAFTRPSETDFHEFIRLKTDAEATNVVTKVLAGTQTDAYTKSCEFNNRFLWDDVKKDGKTVYIGAFGHWFDRNEPTAKPIATHQ